MRTAPSRGANAQLALALDDNAALHLLQPEGVSSNWHSPSLGAQPVWGQAGAKDWAEALTFAANAARHRLSPQPRG
ncbi:MAG TPA: hypothetical protein VNW30_10680 [Opitutaceae bacterium]|nr:hypothetical protein [Opitutaceae bacterium]